MKDIDKNQIRKEFEENDIHGMTPEQTEEMVDAFATNMQFIFSGMERFKNPPEPRKRTADTMHAMKHEVKEFLETYKTYSSGRFIAEPTIEFLRRAIKREPKDVFFAYMDVLGQERDTLYQLFNLNLYLEE